jgi:glycine/D-amino acid oxidase-like deaminating enzyme
MYTPASDGTAPAQTPYIARGGDPLSLSSLQGEQQADVAIVGGGIAGCSAALHAAELGARVVLMEGQSIGWGASSRNAGHLPASTKHEPDEILRRYGPNYGQRILDASENGPRLVMELAQKHGIECDVALPGIINAAHSSAALETLRRRAEYWQARGRPLEILDRSRLAEMTGTELYLGGVLDRRGGCINPLAYVRGLARAALKAGAALHENTRAARLHPEGQRWRVITATGASVVADRVFLCTNAYTDELWPGLRRTVIPVRTVQFLTKPLSDNLRRTILPYGNPMIDTRRVLISLRMNPDGRLHFGAGPRMRAGSAPAWSEMRNWLGILFPQIGEIELETSWGGWMAFNKVDSWQMHELAPGVHAALGCNGRGVALATIYGRDLARLAAGTPPTELTLPLTRLDPVRFHAFSGLGAAAIVRWYRFRDAIEMRRLQSANAQARAAAS